MGTIARHAVFGSRRSEQHAWVRPTEPQQPGPRQTMQITKQTVPEPPPVSFELAVSTYTPPARTRVRDRIRWLFDIDDGAGAVVCMACVLAVFGTLFVRLVQLDNTLENQQLQCRPLDKTTLQMECKFE
jgi:hypothetical protein